MAITLSTTQALADRYVREGALGSGNGSDWTNAYTSIANAEANVTRGETIWMADGTYGAVTFNVPASGTSRIYVKKATTAAHGTDTGWANAYGDGVATFTASGTVVEFETAYWTFDGVSRTSATSGHGFKILKTGTTNATYGIHLDTASASNIVISNVEITHNDACTSTNLDANQSGIRSAGSGADYVTVSYSYIHDMPFNLIIAVNASNWTVEHNYFARSHSTASSHGQAIYMGFSYATGWAIRYNTFKDINGSAWIFMSTLVENVDIYGNVFWEDADSVDCGIYSANYVVDTNSSSTANNIRFHNNTMIDIDGRGSGSGGVNFDAGSGNTAYNNLWYGAVVPGASFSNVTHNYNAFSGSSAFSENNAQTGILSSIFTGYATGNFRLISPTSAGTSLSIPYNFAPDGNTRGADGVWDRGAFEYIGQGGPPPPPTSGNIPNPPDVISIQ